LTSHEYAVAEQCRPSIGVKLSQLTEAIPLPRQQIIRTVLSLRDRKLIQRVGATLPASYTLTTNGRRAFKRQKQIRLRQNISPVGSSSSLKTKSKFEMTAPERLVAELLSRSPGRSMPQLVSALAIPDSAIRQILGTFNSRGWLKMKSFQPAIYALSPELKKHLLSHTKEATAKQVKSSDRYYPPTKQPPPPRQKASLLPTNEAWSLPPDWKAPPREGESPLLQVVPANIRSVLKWRS
jgi:hypothetical protein